jgi:4-phosphopantoate---beta-alanine ligase
VIRERIIQGVKEGMTSTMGLIAQGRGEAFDYLLGERSIPPAQEATRAAVAAILLAKDPVFSVNGNAAVLAPHSIVSVARALGMKLEVNIFHRTKERMKLLHLQLLAYAGEDVEILGLEPDRKLHHVDHPRALCCEKGIYNADLIFVPLEDGDRAQALKDMGKRVVVVDLNPLSRSSRSADITIVDNLVRVLENMLELAAKMTNWDQERLVSLRDGFSNQDTLRATVDWMVDYLRKDAL